MIDDLNDKQNSRAAALKVSREVLSERSGGAFSSTTKPVDTLDLLLVASWVIDGKNSWKPTKKKNKKGASNV